MLVSCNCDYYLYIIFSQLLKQGYFSKNLTEQTMTESTIPPDHQTTLSSDGLKRTIGYLRMEMMKIMRSN